MPVCSVCGGDDFEEADGLFYCSECQTQSQVMQSVEVEETDGPVLSMGTLREIGQKKKGREHSEHFKNEYEAGRPWAQYEAYQLIMQAQADSLITLGARPSIKDAILRLWAKYLSKLGVAFTDDIRLIPKTLEGLPWHRELSRGDLEHPEVVHKRLVRSLRNREDLANIRKTSKDKEMQSAAAALAGETFYKGDNPFEKEIGGDGSDSSAFSECYSSNDSSDEEDNLYSHARPGDRKKRHHDSADTLYDMPERMCLRRTLVFCYLGCLFTSPWITVSDIIRWANEGCIPYLETTHLLHSDMKLSAFDSILFRPVRPTVHKILWDAGALSVYLDIQEFPPFAVKWIISRFIVSLDLPAEMHLLVLNLYAKMPVNVIYRPSPPYGSSMPNIDALCAAYVVVMLKMIFGLNDSIERKLALYTKKVQTVIGSGTHLFDWSLWQAHVTDKFMANSSLHLNYKDPEEKMTDANKLCQVFHRAGYEGQTFCAMKLYNKSKMKKDARFKPENREMLKRPFSVLLERWTQREERAERLRHQVQHAERFDDDDDEQPSMDQGKKGDNNFTDASMCERSEQFKHSTLQHITQPGAFLRKVLARMRNRDDPFGTYTQVPSSPVEGSPALSSPEARRASRKTWNTAGLPGTESASDFAGTSSSSTDESILQSLLSEHVSAQDKYIIYHRLSKKEQRDHCVVQDTWEAKHCSYRWLLSVCHHLTYCSIHAIERAVIQIERHLLTHNSSQSDGHEANEVHSAGEFESDVASRAQSIPSQHKKHGHHADVSRSTATESAEAGTGAERSAGRVKSTSREKCASRARSSVVNRASKVRACIRARSAGGVRSADSAGSFARVSRKRSVPDSVASQYQNTQKFAQDTSYSEGSVASRTRSTDTSAKLQTGESDTWAKSSEGRGDSSRSEETAGKRRLSLCRNRGLSNSSRRKLSFGEADHCHESDAQPRVGKDSGDSGRCKETAGKERLSLSLSKKRRFSDSSCRKLSVDEADHNDEMDESGKQSRPSQGRQCSGRGKERAGKKRLSVSRKRKVGNLSLDESVGSNTSCASAPRWLPARTTRAQQPKYRDSSDSEDTESSEDYF